MAMRNKAAPRPHSRLMIRWLGSPIHLVGPLVARLKKQCGFATES
jgi:hypothetical protein